MPLESIKVKIFKIRKNKHNAELQRTAPGTKDLGAFSLKWYKHFKNKHNAELQRADPGTKVTE